MKRVVRTMLGCKSYWAAQGTIAGIEVIHTPRKDQLVGVGGCVLARRWNSRGHMTPKLGTRESSPRWVGDKRDRRGSHPSSP